MKENEEFLYNLLPAIYRQRDIEMGEPLRGLMAVIETVMRSLESDIDDLYDNWFIETCEDWVVPYIGDLMGVSVLHPISPDSFSQRAFVANTLAYRRQKGTAFVLEQLAKDATGWPARVVEFFQHLATTQNLNHVRLSSSLTPDLKDPSRLESLNGPFDTTVHTISLGGTSDSGYNINKIGLFFWAFRSYPVTKGIAHHHKNGLYRFNPLGVDMPLFNRPRPEREITHLAEEINVPGKLRRWALYKDLENYRNSMGDDKADYDKVCSLYFGDDGRSVFEIFLDGDNDAIRPENILICDLGGYEEPGWIPPTPSNAKYKVAVDPERGRLALLEENTEVLPKVQVSYSYGFSADIGGGPYDRRDSLRKWLDSLEWRTGLDSKHVKIQKIPQDQKCLIDAIEDWNGYAEDHCGAVGVIAITDSGSYDTTSIKIPAGSKLAIVAANLTELGLDIFSADQLDTGSFRPHIRGDFSVNSVKAEDISGEASEEDASEGVGELVLDGLLIEGKLEVGKLERLRLFHSTLVPDNGGLVVPSQENMMGIEIFRCICGTIQADNRFLSLVISDSVIDGLDGDAIRAEDVKIKLQASTIFGMTNVLSLEAENSIFTGTVIAKRGQEGCVRFCYLPMDSQTPRRYRCLPELALKDVNDLLVKTNFSKTMAPSFTSEHYGHPGYAQLSQTTPEGIRLGAEDGQEMGVFNILKQSQREDNLLSCMDEYLRFGLELKMYHVD